MKLKKTKVTTFFFETEELYKKGECAIMWGYVHNTII